MGREQILLIVYAGEENNAGSIKDKLKNGWHVVCANTLGNAIHYILERVK